MTNNRTFLMMMNVFVCQHLWGWCG